MTQNIIMMIKHETGSAQLLGFLIIFKLRFDNRVEITADYDLHNLTGEEAVVV